MAEKIISPGVFTKEIDQSFLPAGVQAIGAAVIGPTSKGPAMVPVTVSSYSEFVNIFGGKFESGSGANRSSYKYLTNYSAQEYLKYADTLTVVRILDAATDGDFAPASASLLTSGSVASPLTAGSGSITIVTVGTSGERYKITKGTDDFTFIASVDGGGDSDDNSVRFFQGSVTQNTHVENLKDEINAVTALGITAVNGGSGLLKLSGSLGLGDNGVTFVTASSASPSTFSTAPTNADAAGLTLSGGTVSAGSAQVAFVLKTLSDGEDQNSGPAGYSAGTNDILPSGSANNLRWEVGNVNNNKGTFQLSIRRGDDTSNRKKIVEQYSNVSLDPNSSNYIEKVIGSANATMMDSGLTDPFIQYTGDYPLRSKYVRVDSVTTKTLNYLDENGKVRVGDLSASLPIATNGVFDGGSDGTIAHPRKMYELIDNTNVQGITFGGSGNQEYIDAIRLLKNQDEYDINLLTLPGLVDSHDNHAVVLTEAINMVEDRSDCFLVIDPVQHGTTNLATVTLKAEGRDSNYVAEYWPWIKIPDNELGKNVWVPASTVIPSVYAFNDRVAAPWFAPAGLNRGGIDIAVMAERKLTHANRDTLYDSNVNPIATFPNAGVTVFGQKTLQKKASALDRVNVRRLLITAKKFIASTTKFLIFENNTAATRNRFLSIVNPYFENVQQRQGLYAFKVVMDETNNTPDVIDRNEMRGQIFLQPAKTAEFIIIDFNIMPTGAAFPE